MWFHIYTYIQWYDSLYLPEAIPLCQLGQFWGHRRMGGEARCQGGGGDDLGHLEKHPGTSEVN